MKDYITRIHVIDGDKQIDHNVMANLLIPDCVMKDTLTVRGIILTKRIDYGSDDQGSGVAEQLYFKKVT